MLKKKYFVKELCNFYIDKNTVYISNKYMGDWLKVPKEIFKLLIQSQKEEKHIDELYDFILDKDDKTYFSQIVERLEIINVLYPTPKFNIDRKSIPKIVISLTNRCNLTCNYCCVDSKIENNKDLPLEEIKQMLDKVVKLSPRKIVISGGEPMLRRDFFEILEYLHSIYDGKIQLATNATLINSKNINRLLKYIFAFDISLDGYDEISCSRVRGNGIFNHVTEVIKIIQNKGCKNISVSMVTGKHNVKDIDRFKEFCNSMSVNPMIKLFSKIGRGSSCAEMYLDNKNDVKYYFQPTYFLKNKDLIKANTCRAGENQIFVNFDGNIYPCPLLQSKEYLICHVNELNETIINQIFSCNYDVLKKIDKIRTLNYEECTDCKYSMFCNNCLAAMDRMTKDENIFIHNCKKLKKINSILYSDI